MSTPSRNIGGPPEIYIRPEFVVDDIGKAVIDDVARPLSLIERIWDINAVRKSAILLGLVVLWQVYTVILDVEPLMFPRFTDSVVALWNALVHGDLLNKIRFSIKVLIYGYSAGLAIAAALVLWATASRIGRDFLATETAMFNPLPAIVLLPLAMLWFGLGTASLVFVLIYSVLWAVALSTHNGFMAVS